MLQWAADPLAVLREIARITRPGGICAITSFAEGTLKELAETFATLDTAPHVNTFLDPMHLTAFAAHADFALLHAEEETFTETYSDLASLMRGIKAIGASNKHEARNKGLMTPSRFKTLEARYREHFGTKKGLPVTWNAITLLLARR
jgi:malonyl-CoA O-methyltransferase